MRKTVFILRWGLLLLVSSGTLMIVSPVSDAGNHCTDRCADVYRLKKDVCKLITGKSERRYCEDKAKQAKEACKHSCR